jgi:DNA-binding CsgD family transcriptional regulator
MTNPAQRDADPDAGQQLLCLVDQAGRLSDIAAGAEQLLGWGPARRGTSLQEAVHPGDVARLVAALGTSAADRRPAILDLRLRGRAGVWTRVRCQVSPLGDQVPARYVLAIRLIPTQEQLAAERASRFEGHLWRIALEVQAAQIGDRSSLGTAWWADPRVVDLTAREGDILRRVVQGETVGSIARQLVVTESTVRNHLSSIYRKFGVTSRSALLSRLMHREV